MSRSVLLSTLNPRLAYEHDGTLYGVRFDCPAEGCRLHRCGGPGQEEGIRIGVKGCEGAEVWARINPDFPMWDRLDDGGEDLSHLTLHPSISDTRCGGSFHGWIRDGWVTW